MLRERSGQMWPRFSSRLVFVLHVNCITSAIARAGVGKNPLSTLTPPAETANTGNTDEHR